MISEKTLLVLKLSMYGSLAVITLISFVSMGVVGSNLTVWEEVETPDTLAILKKDHNSNAAKKFSVLRDAAAGASHGCGVATVPLSTAVLDVQVLHQGQLHHHR